MRIGTLLEHVEATVEPAVGWKIWRVEHDDERTRLRSVLYGSLWPAGRPAVAECKKLLRTRHEAPDSRCECGVHAAKSLAEWRHYLAVGNDRVFGRVLLLGPRLEGEHGWRAAAAYPLELSVPATIANADEIAIGLGVYGIPVNVVGAQPRRKAMVGV